ncbi:GntR family transcriptional regulator [Amycolatopsis sp. NPDC051903]|uniref:GntR family transcriptional regulator n=1 Tax=Amycolatopsis sp. NPDC051903 TaxID=3363936 RepID=UPI003792F980
MSSVLGSPSLTESLAEALRAQIIRGEVAPGLRLTEAWVASRFDVARPTAKAGLDRLCAEGLLRRGPRRSSIVPQLSTEDIRDIYFSREPVETLAVRTLAESKSVPGDAQQALNMMRVAAEQSLHSDHTEADVAFHRALVAAAGSPRLQRMHGTVMGEAQLCIAQVRRTASTDLVELTARHAAIIDAIREGDSSVAEEAMRADLHGCRDMLLADAAKRAGVAV